MLGWVLTFLVVALIAGVLGFGGIAGASVEIAKIIFFIAVVLFLISVIFGIFMIILDTTVVNLAFQTIRREYGAGLNESQWVISIYVLALGIATPMSGFLADRFGIKRMYVGGLAMFTFGSLLCGLAPLAGAQQPQPSGQGKKAYGKVEKKTYQFKEAGKEMEYALFVPSGYDKEKKAPLMVALHGLGGNPQQIIRSRGLTDQAEKYGYIVVAPMGYNSRGWYGARAPAGPGERMEAKR